jgi:hypothetical protein
MGADDHAVRAAVGVDLVVVLRRESRDRLERISTSVESVGRRLPAFSAMACASPTSCAMREARAIK